MRQFACVATLVVAVGLALSACSSKSSRNDPFAGVASPRYPGNGPLPKGGGRYLIGEPYQVAGNWFHPAEQPNYDKVGLASWYGPDYHRRRTSNGEWFDMNYLTAAHATLPLPSYAKVTNLENGHELVVRINDRGPFVGTRIIDLSRQSAEVLGMKGRGTAKVRVQYLGPAPLNDKGSDLVAMNRELQRGTPTDSLIAAASGRRPASPSVQIAGLAPKTLPQEVPPPAQFQPQPAESQSSGYFVQVGSFSDPGNAERMRRELAGLGPVQIMALSGSLGTFYRVRVGPLNDASAAESTLQQVVDAGHADARLIVARSTL
jgi:rare lipoprotein A